VIKRALISVYDKHGLEELVEALGEFDVEIVSSGGTARRIRELGYGKLVEVSDYTGHPESPGGLVKTLHPKVHGGLLLNREDKSHAKWMNENNVKPIDIVVSNLYPFEKVVEGGADLETAAENMDIGGPSMTRSAAKAALLYDRVAIITDPAQYPEVIKTLRENDGELTTELRRRLAEKAFKRTEGYDSAIVSYLDGLEE
jgi:phosphoribosylaminoimidazolecarboxamide formyltransferase/IMP cyclohydrolase